MKFLPLTLLLLSFHFGNGKNQIRNYHISFKEKCFTLSESQEEELLDKFIEVGDGDWLHVATVTRKELSDNRKEAHEMAKKRNRSVAQFFTANGLDPNQITYKYSTVEQLWIHKPFESPNSVHLNTTEKEMESECFTFENGKGISIQMASGNQIVFKPNSFEVPGSEQVQLCVEEYVSKVDFVKYGVTAVGSLGMLESQGMYNIQASYRSEPISLRRGANYQLKIMDGKLDQPFYSFYGKTSSGALEWGQNPNEKFVYEKVNSTSTDTEWVETEYGELMPVTIWEESESVYISGKFSKLGWINCDRFYNEEETITMDMRIKGDSKENPLNVMVVFHDINSVMPAQRVLNGVYKVDGIPKDANVSIVAIAMGEQDPTGRIGLIKTTSQEGKTQKLETKILGRDQIAKLMNDAIY